MLMDLRSKGTQCLLCRWFGEYAAGGERDQLSLAYLLHTHQPRLRAHLIPRRLHWSAAQEADTAACYGATEASAAELALHFLHGGAARAKVLHGGAARTKVLRAEAPRGRRGAARGQWEGLGAGSFAARASTFHARERRPNATQS